MTASELQEVVEQRMTDPAVLGRVACNLGSDAVEQRHHDGLTLNVAWQELGDGWRCTVGSSEPQSSGSQQRRVAQIDIHENATVRVEAYEPCRIAICPEDQVLCLTRFKAQA